MKRVSSLIEGDVILKYQLIPEELDALITVKSDEDLRHMFEEYDRNEIMGTPRLRTFLFPANPIIIENQMGPMDRHSLEQRYINSVNGIIFSPTPTNGSFRSPATNTTNRPTFTISSAGSSPRTPPDQTNPTPDVINPEITSLRNKLGAMPRARSSPSLCNLGQSNHKNPGLTSTLNLGLSNQQYPYHHQNYHQRQPQFQLQSQPHHHYHHHHHHPHPHSSSHSPKPPLDPHPHKNSGHREHAGRASRGGHMGYQRGYDDYYGNSIARYDRESPPGSPLAPNPLQNNYISTSRWAT